MFFALILKKRITERAGTKKLTSTYYGIINPLPKIPCLFHFVSSMRIKVKTLNVKVKKEVFLPHLKVHSI